MSSRYLQVIKHTLLSESIQSKIYRTIVLPLVMHGYETWSLALKEKHRLRVFKNRVLREIFGSEKEEVVGG